MIYMREPLKPTDCASIQPGDIIISVDRGFHEVEEVERIMPRDRPDVKIKTKRGRTLFSNNVYEVLPMKY